LIECDPSIKSIIVNIDNEHHDFIIEDLDEQRVVIKENMLPLLKQKLEQVWRPRLISWASGGLGANQS
jgi:TFIIH basal transcription factor complex TTD-A subunit